MDRQALQWQEDVETLSTTQVFALMDFPLREGLSEAHIFIDKSLSTRLPEIQIFDQLTYDYEDQSIFRKEQSCVAICVLHERAIDPAIRGQVPRLSGAACGWRASSFESGGMRVSAGRSKGVDDVPASAAQG